MHILITVLGVKSERAWYSLRGREAEAELAPLALLEMLPATDRPDSILAVCTSEAEGKTLPLLKEKIAGRLPVASVRVPSGFAQEDVGIFLQEMTTAIPQGEDLTVTVDVTHGLRHFSFLTYVGILYLSALRGVEVRGAYYGNLRRGAPSPFLDLTPLLELPNWIHAIQVLRESGSAGPMASLLGRDTDQKAHRISRTLRSISEAYQSGLPLELGRLAHDFQQLLKPLRNLLRSRHHLPLAAELVDHLTGTLEPYGLEVSSGDKSWKRSVPLTREELERQARLLDDLLERGNYSAAFGLLDEWTVSWVLWQGGEVQRWLDYRGARLRAAGLLGALDSAAKNGNLKSLLTEDQRELAAFWRQLSDVRNILHHHGMKYQVLVGRGQFDKNVEFLRRYWKERLSLLPSFSLDIGKKRREQVLVSPLGRRPGVLYSALRAPLRERLPMPDLCLAICSEESREFVSAATARAEYGGEVKVLTLHDPYGGLEEVKKLQGQAEADLVTAETVLVNVTGGTTLMGLASVALATTARRLARPVRRFGLIDRRPPAEQDAQPYREGEILWLDGQNGDS